MPIVGPLLASPAVQSLSAPQPTGRQTDRNAKKFTGKKIKAYLKKYIYNFFFQYEHMKISGHFCYFPHLVAYVIFPRVDVKSEGGDWTAGAQETAVRLTHQPVTLLQTILGEQRQRSGVDEEQRQFEALRQPQEFLQRLLPTPDRAVSASAS